MKSKTATNAYLALLILSQATAASAQQVDRSLSQAYLESIARFAAKYADAARNQDHERVLQLSCLQLGIAIQYIDPDAHEDVEKKAEIAVLREDSVALREQLREQGYCE